MLSTNLTLRAPGFVPVAGLLLAVLAASPLSAEHRSSEFSGSKVKRGHVTHTVEGGADVLTLSSDFVVPDAPAPHWQLVDARGNVFLLQRLAVKGDRVNMSIRVPSYVSNVEKVQIWCAWAETLLGEASFKTRDAPAHRSTDFAGAKVNGGHVTHSRKTESRAPARAGGGRGPIGASRARVAPVDVLTLSKDFVVPDAPAPHWQIVDSSGNVYLIQSLRIKGDRTNRSITVPAYVRDIAKVQIWCAWAETLLGEASFQTPPRIASR